jgi:DNA-binding transcriptional ArsR family regulator
MNAETKRLYEMKADVLAALAHPIRLAIVDYLHGGEQCVCDIAEHVGAERSNVSRHLAVMVRAGILESRKEGLRMIYRLRTPCVVGFMECVCDVLREQVKANNAVLRRL